MGNRKFKVWIKEKGRDGRIREMVREIECRSMDEVVEIYGLREDDVLDYAIEPEQV